MIKLQRGFEIALLCSAIALAGCQDNSPTTPTAPNNGTPGFDNTPQNPPPGNQPGNPQGNVQGSLDTARGTPASNTIPGTANPRPDSPLANNAAGNAMPEAMSRTNLNDLPPEEEAAVANLEPASGTNVSGKVRFYEDGDNVVIAVEATGLGSGTHGFHIHENGDCSAPDASSAGEHFAPDGRPHGAPSATSDQHHLGDLGNIQADASGTARVQLTNPDISLDDPDSIVGKAVIIHAQRDDMRTQPGGASGDRVACGVIEAPRNAA